MNPTGSDTTGAALLALLILAGARAVDWILPKGWHLKIVHRWAEKNDDTKEITDED